MVSTGGESGDNFDAGGVCGKRVVFGDITNDRSSKRDFSLLGDLGVDSVNAPVKVSNFLDAKTLFAKRMRLGVEELMKDKSGVKLGADGRSYRKGLSSVKDKETHVSLTLNDEIDVLEENVVSSASHRSREVTETIDLLGGRDDLVDSYNIVPHGAVSKDSCASSGSSHTISGPISKDVIINAKFLSNDTVVQGSASHACTSDEVGLGVGRLVNEKCMSVEWARQKSQGCKLSELDRCATFKGHNSSDMQGVDDPLKACTCSFCLTAAHIWSDLHYQDIKGRISVLKKSQKEASMLVSKHTLGKPTEASANRNSKQSKLESDLNGQWKSLFCHMADIFRHESNMLELSFASLKELKDRCKIDLERASGMPSCKF